ncbi:MAG TPA: tripartite tricarboxylate transporter substrate-binding protein, partial [Burkholderiales bacterium]|nr:tripartite tricarboxylate transporter substrate-binding protein [Burkholderiales bacterium]
MSYLKSKVLAAFAVGVFSAISGAHAQPAAQYPSKPIMFVIPFAAGGDSDLSGRNVAQHASKYLNNATIVSVNRVGASGAIGATAVKNAPPDGYTLLVARIGGIPAIRSPAET